MVQFGKGFGKAYDKSGAFTNKGNRQLTNAGVTDTGAFTNWLKNQEGYSGRKALPGMVNQYLAQQSGHSGRGNEQNGGPRQDQPPADQTTDETQPEQPPFPTSPSAVAEQANAQGQVGANFLANGSPVDFGYKNVYNRGIENTDSLMSNLNGYRDLINQYSEGAVNPIIAANAQGILDRNRTDRVSDVESLYNAGGQKMNDFQKAQAAERNAAFQSGLFGSKEKASAEASLAANLFRDRAGKIQQANELSRSEEQGQLEQTRAANLANAGTYSNLYGTDLSGAQNFLNIANNAAQAEANTDLGFRNLGNDALNSSNNTQMSAVQQQADLTQREWENKMRDKEFRAGVIGQILELIQQGKANKIDQALLEKLMSGAGV